MAKKKSSFLFSLMIVGAIFCLCGIVANGTFWYYKEGLSGIGIPISLFLIIAGGTAGLVGVVFGVVISFLAEYKKLKEKKWMKR